MVASHTSGGNASFGELLRDAYVRRAEFAYLEFQRLAFVSPEGFAIVLKELEEKHGPLSLPLLRGR